MTLSEFKAFLAEKWCNLTHGGGHIERDDQGRINWQCAKCGRWSNHPVPHDVDVRVVDRQIQEFVERQKPLGADFERVWDENTDKLYEA